MHWKEWLKSAAVAAGAGACSAICTAILDPRKFNLSDGLMDEFLIALQGAAVGLACLFIRSPMGTQMLRFIEASKQQGAQDHATLDRLRTDIPTPPSDPKTGGRAKPY